MKIDTDREAPYILNRDFWNVQPQWLRWITILVALPAWLVIMLSMFQGDWSPLAINIGFATIFVVAALQLVFFIRSQRRTKNEEISKTR